MTTVDEATREGISPAETEMPESNAASRAQARESLTPDEETAPVALHVAVTERGRAAGRKIALSVAPAAAFLDNPGSLAHSQPPTFNQALARHHECAGHFQGVLLRWPRYAWGYFHLLAIMPVLYLACWLTESPARFFVAAAIAAVIWHFG